MFNPRSLVWALYTHWDAVEGFVRLSREFAVFTSEQALNCIAKVSPELDAEAQGGVLRTLVNAAVLQSLPRSSDLQINAYVLEFVRGLTREHELGLTAVLQARVAAIREATEGLNEGMKGADRDRVSRGCQATGRAVPTDQSATGSGPARHPRSGRNRQEFRQQHAGGTALPKGTGGVR